VKIREQHVDSSADRLLHYIDKSPSPYHAVREARAMLGAAGFTELREADRWDVQAGQGYFVIRGGKTIVAWRQGSGPVAEAGFRIIAAHSDSPVLKLRPRPDLKVRDGGYLTTEIYGSPLLHTWLDRDLHLAGAIFHRDGARGIQCSLVHVDDLRLRAISLAPHLKQEHKIDGVIIDLQKDLPLAFTQGDGDIVDTLRARVADAGGFKPEQLLNFDLCLADAQPSSFGGHAREFISAPRLDNLFSSWCAVAALVGCESASPHTSVSVLYDSEEIGSQTWTGARSNFLDSILHRVSCGSADSAEDFWRAKSRSILLSADMAHAEHPSFKDATDPHHVPEINKGVAIKSSAKGNYAIGHAASAWLEMICRDAGLSLQRFMYRCDHGGGSSVGPIVSTNLGICGVDVGAPMLAMHSAREFAGASDVGHALAVFGAFFASTDAFCS
jgi:aspartyl aminopeptidase